METRQKVLLPEDPELLRELEQSFLQRADLEVILVRDGREAVDLAVKHRPKLVFLDLQMERLAGDACCREIKAHPDLAETVVILITVAGRPDEMATCRNAGCDGILLKPIRRHDFMQVARRHLAVEVRAGGRLRAELMVYYGPAPQRQLENFSVDLSTGGLFIQTDQPLPDDESLTLRFSLPGEQKTISCQARVAWINDPERPKKPSLPAGMGVQFIDLSLDDLKAIRRFLEHSDLEPSW